MNVDPRHHNEPESTVGNRKRGGRRRRVMRVGFLLVLILIIAAVVGYRFVTDPARLSRVARNYLQSFLHSEVSIRRTQFSLLGGIELIDVSVADPGALTPDESPMLHCESIVLKHVPLKLLLGRLTVDAVTITRPVCRAVFNADTRRFNIQDAIKESAIGQPDGDGLLPIVRVEGAHITLTTNNADTKRRVETISVE